jgi:hypothetical protein
MVELAIPLIDRFVPISLLISHILGLHLLDRPSDNVASWLSDHWFFISDILNARLITTFWSATVINILDTCLRLVIVAHNPLRTALPA